MSSSGPLSPSTITEDTSFGTQPWADTGSAVSSNDSYATAQVGPALPYTYYLKATNFGFGIPTDATIDGIYVEFEWKTATASTTRVERVRIVKGGVISSTDLSDAALSPNTDTYQPYGGASSLWGESWTAADINASNFGVVISIRHNAASAPAVSIDHFRITVYYTGAPIEPGYIDLCGFELGTDGYDGGLSGSISGTGSIQSTTVRTGTYALKINPTTTATGSFTLYGIGDDGDVSFNNSYDVTEIYVRFYFRYATKPAANSEEIFSIVDKISGTKFTLRINSAGNLMAFDEGLDQIGSTGSTVLSSNTWYCIDVYSDTGAAVTSEVFLNGTSEISGTGDLGTSTVGRIVFGKITNRNSQSVEFYYDDISVTTDTISEITGVRMVKVASDGTYQDWGGTYSSVDEIPPNDDTDYIWQANTGTLGVSTFGLSSSDIGAIAGFQIHAIKPFAILRRTGGTAGAVKLITRNANTGGQDSTEELDIAGSEYTIYRTIADIFDEDSWLSEITTADLLDLEVGVVTWELPQGSNEIRATSLGVMVGYDDSNVNMSLSVIRFKTNIKTAILNVATVALRSRRLKTTNKSISVIGTSIISLSKIRFKISLKNGGVGQNLALGRKRLKYTVKQFTWISPSGATLGRIRFKHTKRAFAGSGGVPIYPANGLLPLFVQGSTSSQATAFMPVFLFGSTAGTGGLITSLTLYASGDYGRPSGVFPLFLRGAGGSTSGSIPLFLAAPITSGTINGSLNLVAWANWPSGNLKLYIRGSGLSPFSSDGAMQANGSLPLVIWRTDAVEKTIPLFVKVADGTSGLLPLYTNGVTGHLSGLMTLQTTGIGSGTFDMKLFTKGF